ncbi:hypothetical protein pipiens_017600 [Culex pipiens pipiens]|uniref:Uncharacterized protein n=1 Tax=Culex pipiens pipiens TaxID=38569 RepID=A0ABD1CFV1_CULPP
MHAGQLGQRSGKVMAANGGLMDMVASGTGRNLAAVLRLADSVTVAHSVDCGKPSLRSKIVEKGYTMSFTNRGGDVFNSDGDLVETGSNVQPIQACSDDGRVTRHARQVAASSHRIPVETPDSGVSAGAAAGLRSEPYRTALTGRTMKTEEQV